MVNLQDIRRIFVTENYDDSATVPRELLSALLDVVDWSSKLHKAVAGQFPRQEVASVAYVVGEHLERLQRATEVKHG